MYEQYNLSSNNKENNNTKPSSAAVINNKLDIVQKNIDSLNNNLNLIREQLNDIQNTSNKINNLVENKEDTCDTTSTKLDNCVSDEDIIRLKDSGKTYKQIDKLFGYKDGWSRKRIQRYNKEHDTNKLYANFAKKILNSRLNTHKQKDDLLKILGTSSEEWEALRDGLHKADDDTTKTSKQ